jgi:hypothetical protein
MTLPGFTAEAALPSATEPFRHVPTPVTREGPGVGVFPQSLNFCHPCQGIQRVCCSIDVQGFVTCHSVPCLK